MKTLHTKSAFNNNFILETIFTPNFSTIFTRVKSYKYQVIGWGSHFALKWFCRNILLLNMSCLLGQFMDLLLSSSGPDHVQVNSRWLQGQKILSHSQVSGLDLEIDLSSSGSRPCPGPLQKTTRSKEALSHSQVSRSGPRDWLYNW